MTTSAQKISIALGRDEQVRETFFWARGSSEDSRTWVVFSHVNTPPHKFSQSRVVSMLGGASLFLNCTDNNWYKQGVPGAASSPAQLVDWLKACLEGRPATDVTFVGHSMGAYAALAVMPEFPDAGFVVTSPELDLNRIGSRSQDNGVGTTEAWSSLYDRVPQVERSSTGLVLFGAWDPIDAHFLGDKRTYDGRFGQVYVVAHHHGVTEYLTANRYYLPILLNRRAYTDALLKRGSLLELPNADGRAAYRDFASLNNAVRTGNTHLMQSLVMLHPDWANPGWHALVSRALSKLGRPGPALASARRAAHLAPTVAEYPLQYAKMARDMSEAKSIADAEKIMVRMDNPHRAVQKYLATFHKLNES